ncbi:hypothetical protein GCM10012280_51830 [Wenjunlia tyrosinilytica]|uniref:Uncharacterized protein n=1 Tax=Wenjunlia tyrosinilytica TaxID=1544741 RepID=A0A917ZTZ3_9ACTN|nr:hypothetical protein GCM10012280_51830 [Wenjunlia tyrosinilytica]
MVAIEAGRSMPSGEGRAVVAGSGASHRSTGYQGISDRGPTRPMTPCEGCGTGCAADPGVLHAKRALAHVL